MPLYMPLGHTPLSADGRPRILTRTMPTGSQGPEIKYQRNVTCFSTFRFYIFSESGPLVAGEFSSNFLSLSLEPLGGRSRPQIPGGIKGVCFFSSLSVSSLLSSHSILYGWSLQLGAPDWARGPTLQLVLTGHCEPCSIGSWQPWPLWVSVPGDPSSPTRTDP